MADSQVLLAVPNVSEGADSDRLNRIAERFAPASLLDVHSDPDHGRSVYSLAAPQGMLADGLLSGARGDARGGRHHPPRGLHPFVGALDVMPVVYLDEARRGAACAEVLAAAGRDGRRTGRAGGALRRAGHRPGASRARLAAKGRLAALAQRIETGEVRPDFGPRRAHPTAGSILATARPPLIAFNIDLVSDDLDLARDVAARIRESGGGLPGVRAIGLRLAARGRAQVSTNVHDHRATPLREVVEAVRATPRLPRPSSWASRRPRPSTAFPTTCRSGTSLLTGTCWRTRYARSPRWPRPRTSASASTAARPRARSNAPGEPGAGQVKKDSKTIARERRAERMNKEPTWKGAINRAAIAAVVFTALMFVIRSDQGAAANVALGFLVFLFYIPLGYLTDRAIYNFRQRKKRS